MGARSGPPGVLPGDDSYATRLRITMVSAAFDSAAGDEELKVALARVGVPGIVEVSALQYRMTTPLPPLL